MTVPPGLSREELEQNLRHALLVSYEGSTTPLGAVTVFAYIDDGETTDIEGPYTAGTGEFAPFGTWSKADASVPIRRWQASVVLADRYFAPAVEAIPIGAARVLRGSSGDDVVIASTAEQKPGDPVVATVPGGTRVRVKGVARFEVGAALPLLRYEVELLDGSGRHGWVDGYKVKEE